MKKSLIVCFFICVIANLEIKAQSKAFGVKGGINIANLTGDVNSAVTSRVAFHSGIFIEIFIVDKFSVQPELLYSSQGYKFNSEIIGSNDYLKLPLIGKFYPINDLFVEMGPHVGYLLSANEKDATSKVSVTDSYKSIDVGLSFGAGYKISSVGLAMGLRYDLGLARVLDTNDLSRIKNGVFQIYTAYQF